MCDIWIMLRQRVAKLIRNLYISCLVPIQGHPTPWFIPHWLYPECIGNSSSQREFASCAADGWCHASPLKPEYEGSVCLSGRITWGRQWWTASGLQLEPLIPPSNPPSDSWSNLMMPVTAISLSLCPSTWESVFAASHTCLHPCAVMWKC